MTREQKMEQIIKKYGELVIFLNAVIISGYRNHEEELRILTELQSLTSQIEGEGEEDEIDLSSPDYHPICEKCGNRFWTKNSENKICESCKSSITIKPGWICGFKGGCCYKDNGTVPYCTQLGYCQIKQ